MIPADDDLDVAAVTADHALGSGKLQPHPTDDGFGQSSAGGDQSLAGLISGHGCLLSVGVVCVSQDDLYDRQFRLSRFFSGGHKLVFRVTLRISTAKAC